MPLDSHIYVHNATRLEEAQGGHKFGYTSKNADRGDNLRIGVSL